MNCDVEFYFNPRRFLFVSGCKSVFLARHEYQMRVPPQVTGHEDLTIELPDFTQIFSPVLRTTVTDDCAFIAGPEGEARYQGDPRSLQVPLRKTLSQVWGGVCRREGEFWIFAPEDAPLPYQERESLRTVLRGKHQGELSRLFYFDKVARLLPYRLYLPTILGTAVTMPLLVILHGGGSSVDEVFELSRHRISQLAEEKGFAVLSADGCVFNSSYGCPYPPQGVDPASELFRDSPRKQWEREVSLQALLAVIRLVQAEYPLQEKILLAGNSMGGMGTFYFASRYPHLVRAIAPAGAAPDMRAFQSEVIADLPIFFTAGTEDYHGFDHLKAAYEQLLARGHHIQFCPVGGGSHERAWIAVMDRWVEFLLRNCIC